MGLRRAGFKVVGVDIDPQPNYPFQFKQGDALTFPLSGFDFIWASPPCQAHTQLRGLGKANPNDVDLIPAVRARLQRTRSAWVIENVLGSSLIDPVVLCGSMFGLAVRRHRLFEANFSIPKFDCSCRQRKNVAVYGKAPGHRLPDGVQRARDLAHGSWAMGIDWMTWGELTQAIPPAYAEHVARSAISEML